MREIEWVETEPHVFRPADWKSHFWKAQEWHELDDGRMILPDHRIDKIFAAPNNGVFLRRQALFPLVSGETCLTIRAYAHDRLVFTAAPVTLPPATRKRRKRARLALRGAQHRVLERRRETQDKAPIRGGHGRIPAATNFTRHGSLMVRDGGHLIERDSVGKAVFLTLTIAGHGNDVFNACSSYSGYLVNVFGTWLREWAVNGWYVYVWELQSRGAPHLHYMVSIPKGVSIRTFRKKVQAEWRRCLLLASRKSGVDLFKNRYGGTYRNNSSMPYVGAKLCTHDLGRYMAKYASKSKSKTGGKNTWRPGRWWALSYPLRKAVLQERVTLKIKFPSSTAARAALSNLMQRSAPRCHAPYFVPADKTFGAVVACVDTWVGQAKPLALALKILIETGQVLPVLGSVVEFAKAA